MDTGLLNEAACPDPIHTHHIPAPIKHKGYPHPAHGDDAIIQWASNQSQYNGIQSFVLVGCNIRDLSNDANTLIMRLHGCGHGHVRTYIAYHPEHLQRLIDFRKENPQIVGTMAVLVVDYVENFPESFFDLAVEVALGLHRLQFWDRKSPNDNPEF